MYFDLDRTHVKASRYTCAPDDYFVFQTPSHVRFTDAHKSYHLKFSKKKWHCSCQTFETRRKVQAPGHTPFCKHTIAIEKICRNSSFNTFNGWFTLRKILDAPSYELPLMVHHYWHSLINSITVSTHHLKISILKKIDYRTPDIQTEKH